MGTSGQATWNERKHWYKNLLHKHTCPCSSALIIQTEYHIIQMVAEQSNLNVMTALLHMFIGCNLSRVSLLIT